MTYRISKQKLNMMGEPIKGARRKICLNMYNIPNNEKAINDALAFLNSSPELDHAYRYELVEALRWKHVCYFRWSAYSNKWIVVET